MTAERASWSVLAALVTRVDGAYQLAYALLANLYRLRTSGSNTAAPLRNARLSERCGHKHSGRARSLATMWVGHGAQITRGINVSTHKLGEQKKS